MKKKLHIGCSPLTAKIYAGTILKEGCWSSDKQDVTDQAVSAVAQHFVQLDQHMEFTFEGKEYIIQVITKTE